MVVDRDLLRIESLGVCSLFASYRCSLFEPGPRTIADLRGDPILEHILQKPRSLNGVAASFFYAKYRPRRRNLPRQTMTSCHESHSKVGKRAIPHWENRARTELPSLSASMRC
jgi:hypothetical protein